MIETVCDQHQLIKHSLNFILKKKMYLKVKRTFHLDSRSQVNFIFVNSVNLHDMSTLDRIICSLKAKIGQSTATNKQAKQTTIFLLKNKVFLSPILQNLNERSVLDNSFLKMILELNKPKKISSSRKFYLFRKMVKNAKW